MSWKFILAFSSRFLFLLAVKKCKNQNIWNCNFPCCHFGLWRIVLLFLMPGPSLCTSNGCGVYILHWICSIVRMFFQLLVLTAFYTIIWVPYCLMNPTWGGRASDAGCHKMFWKFLMKCCRAEMGYWCSVSAMSWFSVR